MMGRAARQAQAWLMSNFPEDAEHARHTRHKQMMGTRYIECMILMPGQPSCSLSVVLLLYMRLQAMQTLSPHGEAVHATVPVTVLIL
jgi:hypothetical protein